MKLIVYFTLLINCSFANTTIELYDLIKQGNLEDNDNQEVIKIMQQIHPIILDYLDPIEKFQAEDALKKSLIKSDLDSIDNAFFLSQFSKDEGEILLKLFESPTLKKLNQSREKLNIEFYQKRCHFNFKRLDNEATNEKKAAIKTIITLERSIPNIKAILSSAWDIQMYAVKSSNINFSDARKEIVAEVISRLISSISINLNDKIYNDNLCAFEKFTTEEINQIITLERKEIVQKYIRMRNQISREAIAFFKEKILKNQAFLPPEKQAPKL